MSGRRGSNPRPTAWKAVALPTELLPLLSAEASAKAESIRIQLAVRRALKQLKNFIILCPPSLKLRRTQWAEEDSNLRSRKTADLQSAPFGRSGICPAE